ncbi:transcription termination factor 5, mitochondrial-like [Maniola hyperantus]|uniref:transcription termination factor 5, mitochondrial-like n=1 Tax=Aphantopus hyperantus TaxID=2795564 RepID=UPI00156A238F|nr:transcription termination factor 5, mitochondrial-like [Maniola hyperantus]
MYLVQIIQTLQKSAHIGIASRKTVIKHYRQYCRGVPFISLYNRVIGTIPDNILSQLEKKHPKVIRLSDESLQCTLQVLSKFGISAEDACLEPHIFCMNPITMDNYGEILKECDFSIILPKHIIRYHTLVKSRTISQLKKEGLLRDDAKLEELLHEYFHEWPKECHDLNNFQDTDTNILTVRMSVLERYLQWRLCITTDEFKNYCKNYLPLKHRPMCDIKEALNIAENDIKFNKETIRRNGFIISSDPVNTKLILENVEALGGVDIREVVRSEPAILKNNYQAILEIRNLLTQYNISDDAQQHCFRVYCMRPKTVQERLEQLSNVKEYKVLSTNPRVLYMVVHERKMMNRLNKIRAAKKQCYSLNHLVSSNKLFNTYISSFGDKVCSKDIAILISTSLHARGISNKSVLDKLKRHKYWLHTALNAIGENIHLLKKQFDDDVIFDNCQILLYPVLELEQYVNFLLKLRKGDMSPNESSQIELDATYNNINCRILTDRQILSLVLYEIEKKYHFSGDGIWNRLDGGKADTQVINKKLKQCAN